MYSTEAPGVFRSTGDRHVRMHSQVINSTEAPGVFRSPYMFARKVDPDVDAETVRALRDEGGRGEVGRVGGAGAHADAHVAQATATRACVSQVRL